MWLHPSLRQRLLLLAVPWFGVGITSYGMHFAVKHVPFDVHTVAVVKETANLVAILLCIPVYNKVGAGGAENEWEKQVSEQSQD